MTKHASLLPVSLTIVRCIMSSPSAHLKGLRARYKAGLVPNFYTQLLPHKHIQSSMFNALRGAVLHGLKLTFDMIVEGFEDSYWRAKAIHLAYSHACIPVDVALHMDMLESSDRDYLLTYLYKKGAIVPDFELHMKRFEDINSQISPSKSLVLAFQKGLHPTRDHVVWDRYRCLGAAYDHGFQYDSADLQFALELPGADYQRSKFAAIEAAHRLDATLTYDDHISKLVGGSEYQEGLVWAWKEKICIPAPGQIGRIDEDQVRSRQQTFMIAMQYDSFAFQLDDVTKLFPVGTKNHLADARGYVKATHAFIPIIVQAYKIGKLEWSAQHVFLMFPDDRWAQTLGLQDLYQSGINWTYEDVQDLQDLGIPNDWVDSFVRMAVTDGRLLPHMANMLPTVSDKFWKSMFKELTRSARCVQQVAHKRRREEGGDRNEAKAVKAD